MRTVVIVPWDYDAACRRTAWTRSVQWVPVGEPGFYRRPRLRPEEDWAGGLQSHPRGPSPEHAAD